MVYFYFFPWSGDLADSTVRPRYYPTRCSSDLVGCFLVRAPAGDGLERVALVEDVVDQQHAPPLHRRGGTMQPGQPRTGGVAAVAGGVQVVELDVEPALAERERQLRRERHAAVHDGDEQRRSRIVLIVAADRVGQSGRANVCTPVPNAHLVCL